MTDYTRTQSMIDEDEKRWNIKKLLSNNGIHFDKLPYIDLMDYDNIVNSMGFYKTVLTELPQIKDGITSIGGGLLSGKLDSMFNISETPEGLIRVYHAEVVDVINRKVELSKNGKTGKLGLLKKIKITDSEHLTEDFNAIYGELKDAVNDYYANHEVTLNIEDLPNVDNKMTL